jgi:hypothetical protein
MSVISIINMKPVFVFIIKLKLNETYIINSNTATVPIRHICTNQINTINTKGALTLL